MISDAHEPGETHYECAGCGWVTTLSWSTVGFDGTQHSLCSDSCAKKWIVDMYGHALGPGRLDVLDRVVAAADARRTKAAAKAPK